MTAFQRLHERVDLIAGHVTALLERAEALERVARELRVEAAFRERELRKVTDDLNGELARRRMLEACGRDSVLKALRKRHSA